MMLDVTWTPRSILNASLVVAASLGVACASSPPTAEGGDTKRDNAVQTEVPMDPGFSIETFEGDTFSFGEQRGTPVVLNFWESW